MSQALEVRQLALDEFDQRYAALRLQATSEARQAMIQSLRRYGQISPLVVWPSAGAWVLIDGFKRVEAARQVPELLTLDARLIEADPRTAKAAIYGLNRLSRRVPPAGRSLDRVRLGARGLPDAVGSGPVAGAR
jgi:ParB-like chromosome segregation protein Spo0J